MKFLGWYSFAWIAFVILWYLPQFFSMGSQSTTAFWVIVVYTPIAIYCFKTAREQK